jgi:hypothetical protein
MRILLALAALLAVSALAPSAAAAQCPPVCVYVHPAATLPSASCPDCLGLAVSAGTLEPAGCNDCGGIGAEASVEHGNGATTVSALVCRGGFVVICPVDETLTV